MTDDEKLIRAKDATAYNLVGMPDERFESMVARLVRLEFPPAFKPANTLDGGADMVLPRDSGGGYERSWQSKHYPKRINWDKCKASLAAARKHWEPAHYTFVFPRELSAREQDTFDEHFRGPAADITVDYWNGEELQFRLCGSDAAQRVALTFFDHAVDDHKRTLQAIEAGGSLDAPSDVLDRLLNIGGSLAGRDAFFMYPAATHETDGPGPPMTPGTVMSVQRSDGDITSRIDVRGIRVWAHLLNLQRAVVEDVWVGDEGEILVVARPGWWQRDRCEVCGRRSPGLDLGKGRRRWRALDLRTTLAFVEADAPTAACRGHGVVVCAVRGHVTTRGSPGRSRTRRRGWPSTRATLQLPS